MSDSSVSSAGLSTKSAWAAAEVVVQEAEKQSGFFHWWYRMTAVPEPPANASFVRREAVRRVRLLSSVTFFLIITLLFFLPACLFLPNHLVTFADATMIGIAIGALMINRTGQSLLAGTVIVVSFELALTFVILTTLPFDETSIQLYDLYIMGELLAVSLLPVRSVFVLAALNSLLISGELAYQPHTQVLLHDLQTQFIPVLARPVGLQIIVAGVAFLWVSSTTRAIARADRAEMVAALEHTIVEQKLELERGIEQILQTHVAVANGNLNARAPLTQDNILWQIARALNNLLVRLQRAMLAEKELQRVEQAISFSVRLIQQAEQEQRPPHLIFTRTTIDPLIAALQGKTLAHTRVPFERKSSSGQLPVSSENTQGQAHI